MAVSHAQLGYGTRLRFVGPKEDKDPAWLVADDNRTQNNTVVQVISTTPCSVAVYAEHDPDLWVRFPLENLALTRFVEVNEEADRLTAEFERLKNSNPLERKIMQQQKEMLKKEMSEEEKQELERRRVIAEKLTAIKTRELQDRK